MRSRKYKPLRSGGRYRDVLKSFTKDQLAWIGAVAMAYNDAEQWLQFAFLTATSLPCNRLAVVTRLGSGELPNLVMECIRTYVRDESIHKLAERTLVGEGFSQLKTYRDGVVHARLWDMQTALATVPNKGAEDSVLLTNDAVEGLYRRLSLVRDELVELADIISAARGLWAEDVQKDPKLAPHKAQLEESIRVASAQLARLQKQRKSLPPLPAFPKELPQYDLTPHRPGEHLV